MPTIGRDKMQEARLQARAKRQADIDEKLAQIDRVKEAGGDTAELERELAGLRDDWEERRNARREAKKRARELKDEISAAIGKRPQLRWNESEEGRAARAGIKEQRGAEMQFALQPGQMVKLINDARVAHEGQWVYSKTLPAGSIGILIDPPTSNFSAVMFGADVWKVPTKKLRAADN